MSYAETLIAFLFFLLWRRALADEQGDGSLFFCIEIGKSAAILPSTVADDTEAFPLDFSFGLSDIIHHKTQMIDSLSLFFQMVFVETLALSRLYELKVDGTYPGHHYPQIVESLCVRDIYFGVFPHRRIFRKGTYAYGSVIFDRFFDVSDDDRNVMEFRERGFPWILFVHFYSLLNCRFNYTKKAEILLNPDRSGNGPGVLYTDGPGIGLCIFWSLVLFEA